MPLLIFDLTLNKRQAGKAEMNLVQKKNHRENKQTVQKRQKQYSTTNCANPTLLFGFNLNSVCALRYSSGPAIANLAGMTVSIAVQPKKPYEE
jgi:hypothetical protein